MNGTLELYDCQLKFNRGRPTMEWWKIFIDAYDRDVARRMKVIYANEVGANVENIAIEGGKVVGLWRTNKKPRTLHRKQPKCGSPVRNYWTWTKLHDPERFKRHIENITLFQRSPECRREQAIRAAQQWESYTPSKKVWIMKQLAEGRKIQVATQRRLKAIRRVPYIIRKPYVHRGHTL